MGLVQWVERITRHMMQKLDILIAWHLWLHQRPQRLHSDSWLQLSQQDSLKMFVWRVLARRFDGRRGPQQGGGGAQRNLNKTWMSVQQEKPGRALCDGEVCARILTAATAWAEQITC
ncbi:predicted protein [Coccidioides posadasii str. Silveira]|uniref:Predicted protein n=1 Tax=Coccidioides posadasii (strain RMSCC 757 / Silveira) TaxID=443226 RepID=E9D8S1_COCPS|nr:predicted protein [Coccidioides posadasii str. Silveira]